MTEKMMGNLMCWLGGLAAFLAFCGLVALFDSGSELVFACFLVFIAGLYVFGANTDFHLISKTCRDIAVLLVWFLGGMFLMASLVVSASAQNFAGGFRCEDATGRSGESVRALFRTDGHLAYYRENPDGAFMRLSGCGGASTECSNAVLACFGVQIGIETPLGVILPLDGPSVGRTISSGAGIWFFLFTIGLVVALIRYYRRFHSGGSDFYSPAQRWRDQHDSDQHASLDGTRERGKELFKRFDS